MSINSSIQKNKLRNLLLELERTPECRRKAVIPKLFNKYADTSYMKKCTHEEKLYIIKACHDIMVEVFIKEGFIK